MSVRGEASVLLQQDVDMGVKSAKPSDNAMSRMVKRCVIVLFAILPGMASAQPPSMEEGRDFVAITPPIATEAAEDIIEVLDVFWYGCPVCEEFEPMMTYWGSQIRGDLVMRRMPAIWNDVMRTHAQLYFTARQLEVADRAHTAAFRHIHEDRQPLNTLAQVRAFFTGLGVAEEDFERAWNSPEVAAALDKATQETAAAGIDRLPALVVNGRYRVVRNESVPELPELVTTTNQLIRTQREVRRID